MSRYTTLCGICSKSFVSKNSGASYCMLCRHNNRPPSSGDYVVMHENNTTIKEQVKLAQALLGRKLERNECVHHINFVRNCNVPENLIVMYHNDHSALHAYLYDRYLYCLANHFDWVKHIEFFTLHWIKGRYAIKLWELSLEETVV